MVLIFVRVILSWFRISPYGFWSGPYKFLVNITEPVLRIFRKIIPFVRMGNSYLDLSYIVVILVVQLLIV
ncbi:MAG: YggT family protein, partial [Actinobacteria bacterium]|nr:YggT family protein [Actinomycetota bacterium]